MMLVQSEQIYFQPRYYYDSTDSSNSSDTANVQTGVEIIETLINNQNIMMCSGNHFYLHRPLFNQGQEQEVDSLSLYASSASVTILS